MKTELLLLGGSAVFLGVVGSCTAFQANDPLEIFVNPDTVPTAPAATRRPNSNIAIPVEGSRQSAGTINTPRPGISPTPLPAPTPEVVAALLDLRAECPIATENGQVFKYTNLDEVWAKTYLSGVADLGSYHVCVFSNFTLVNDTSGKVRFVLQQDPSNSSCARNESNKICTQDTGSGLQVTWTRGGPVPLVGGILNPPPLTPMSRQTQTPGR